MRIETMILIVSIWYQFLYTIFVLISQNKTQERMNKEIVNGIKLETSDNRSVSIVSIGLIGITVVKFWKLYKHNSYIHVDNKNLAISQLTDKTGIFWSSIIVAALLRFLPIGGTPPCVCKQFVKSKLQESDPSSQRYISHLTTSSFELPKVKTGNEIKLGRMNPCATENPVWSFVVIQSNLGHPLWSSLVSPIR